VLSTVESPGELTVGNAIGRSTVALEFCIRSASSASASMAVRSWASRFLTLLRAGHFRSTAARATGRSPRVVGWWIRAGKLGASRDLAAFVQQVELAEAAFEVQAVQIVTRATALNPGLALQFLRLRYPERFTLRSHP